MPNIAGVGAAPLYPAAVKAEALNADPLNDPVMGAGLMGTSPMLPGLMMYSSSPCLGSSPIATGLAVSPRRLVPMPGSWGCTDMQLPASLEDRCAAVAAAAAAASVGVAVPPAAASSSTCAAAAATGGKVGRGAAPAVNEEEGMGLMDDEDEDYGMAMEGVDDGQWAGQLVGSLGMSLPGGSLGMLGGLGSFPGLPACFMKDAAVGEPVGLDLGGVGGPSPFAGVGAMVPGMGLVFPTSVKQQLDEELDALTRLGSDTTGSGGQVGLVAGGPSQAVSDKGEEAWSSWMEPLKSSNSEEEEDGMEAFMEMDVEEEEDLSGCSPATAAMFDDIMLGANWGMMGGMP